MQESLLSTNCKLCGFTAKSIGSKDLGRGCLPESPCVETGVKVQYYTCKKCGLTFTPFFDSWSTADWEREIYNIDYALYDPEYLGKRAQDNLSSIPGILAQLNIKPTRKLDYGSGTGDFAKGFGAEAYDPYSAKIPPEGLFDLITAFEVVEHSTQPYQVFHSMREFLDKKGVILFTTLTINRPSIDNWYIAPRNGHVTIYNKASLEYIARELNLKYHSLNDNLHLFYR